MAGWLERRRAARLELARLRLADEEHELDRWGFAMTPSRYARQEKRIEQARARVERLAPDESETA